MSRRTRREFVRDSAALTTALAAAGSAHTAAARAETAVFASRWQLAPNRSWIGPEFWANPLQDWRVHEGRLECIKAAPERHVHLITGEIVGDSGTFRTTVRVGRPSGSLTGGPGSAGFRIGITAPLPDFRHALLFGNGLNAGITGSGKLFLGDPTGDDAVELAQSLVEVDLQLDVESDGDQATVTLRAVDPRSGKSVAQVSRRVDDRRVSGQIALVANLGEGSNRRRPKPLAGVGSGRFWFADWRAEGSKLRLHPKRSFGPILFSQYTLSRGVLKLTAQMPPIGQDDEQRVRLEVDRGNGWAKVDEASIDPDARTATFRVEEWDASTDVPYRVRYTLRLTDGTSEEHDWAGTVRRDPADRPRLSVADISCNGHMAFPNAEYVDNMSRLDPDLLAFTGDQFYEPSGGYGVQRGPVDMATLDLLRKWYLHGWTWRELMRDRPSISIPDDHDVYQGNIWGEGGEPQRGTQEMGGYNMPPEWVNVVHRTQTSHHPDPFDSKPGKRGISVYYGPLVYGGVSFAIVADRQFKSAPEGKVPPTGDRGDHVIDPDFDPATADVPGLDLLGDRQMEFLRQWVTDWQGARMKAVISQTIFTAMATTHGGKREVLRADYDANGWPQTARNDALRTIRQALAFHIAGDQHLPAVIRYGIDQHGDAGCALAGPAVNSIYPRWFEPTGKMVVDENSELPGTGQFFDHFGHPLTVLAVANPTQEFHGSVLEVERDKACGLSLVHFDKQRGTVTVDCWPLLVDPAEGGKQFAGWPVSIDPVADAAAQARAWLPTLQFSGEMRPVVEVRTAEGELLYNLRPAGSTFQPHVFAGGEYRVRVYEPETNRAKEFDKLAARETNDETIQVML